MKKEEEFIIWTKPNFWHSGTGGTNGIDIVQYPYKSIIIEIEGIAIKDQNGFGWDIKAIQIVNEEYFKKSPLQINLNLI